MVFKLGVDWRGRASYWSSTALCLSILATTGLTVKKAAEFTDL
jgi:hypothetical protein